MAFGSRFNPKGGKKGMRQVTGKQQPHQRMKPAPARKIQPIEEDDDDASHAYDYNDDDQEGDDDEPQYGYREALQGEVRPLVGLKVSVSGCGATKEDLLALAEEYGAERHGGLQEDTTHVVTDRPLGQKYQVALSRRMHVMQPSWLPAVREAWCNGDEVDWVMLEDKHTMPPLFGVVACLTHFARGEYKDQLKALLTLAGATVSDKLDNLTTHLIVASPAAPHSQTPSSEKLLHARRNRHRLHPEFSVVWEGWAREAILYGGRRPERDQVWVWSEKSQEEPPMDVGWAVSHAAPRSGQQGRTGTASSKLPSAVASTSAPSAARPAASQSRSLVAAGAGPASRTSFRGYDTSLTDSFGADELPVPPPLASAAATAGPSVSTAYDPNGRVVKKKKTRGVGAAPSHAEPDSLLEAYGASQQTAAGELSRFADADTTALPSLDEILARPDSRPAAEADADVGMALELVDGEVEPQWVPKSKSAIKAVSARREEGFAPDDKNGGRKEAKGKGKGKVVGKKANDAPIAGANDDSAFFDAAPQLSDPPGAAAAAAGGATQASSSEQNSSPSDDTPPQRIFEGKKLALMEIKGPDPRAIKAAIEARGGEVVIDASEEELESVDWILVDFVEAPAAFTGSSDNRVVTICWLEVCIFFDRFIEPEDRLLERPIPFACPVPGLDQLRIHFSGFGRENEPLMHFNRRFTHSIGATQDVAFSRSSTHLVVRQLEDDPSLCPSDLDGSTNPKVARAREWGKTICSLRELRRIVRERAEEVEREKEGSAASKGKGKGKGKVERKRRERSVREITNELDERQDEEESMRGPLGDCVVFISPKIDVDRKHLASVVQDLGGVVTRQYSESVTHLIHFGSKATESFKDFRLAKNDGAFIVHPRWIEECGRTSSRASEGDFPHTFDALRGGQLFDMGMSVNPSGGSPPRGSPSMSRQASAEGASPRGQPVSRSPSKLSLGRGRASTSPKNSPGGASEGGKGRKRALDLEAEEEPSRGQAGSPSPSPRRRRSDTTATEVADTTTDLALPSPSAAANSVVPETSSSPRRADQPAPSSSADRVPSSDPFELPPLASETRSPEGGAGGGGVGGTTQLRHQTSLLMAQLMDAPQGEKPSRTRSKSTLNRKRSSATTSLSTSSRISPLAGDTTTASTSDNLSSLAPPRRIPGTSYGFEPTQATQEGESLYVVYDNPAEAAAREQIRLALAAGGKKDEEEQRSPPRGSGESQGAGGAGDTPRTGRSTRAATGRK
ncbi:hypothetical protein JCM6882_000578 [Rhodosporidiobolus microsporus]